MKQKQFNRCRQAVSAMRSRIVKRGTFFSHVLATIAIILLACVFRASSSSLPGPSSTEGRPAFCRLHQTSLAQPDARLPGSDEVGLQVGKQAPAFTLQDQNDRPVSLQLLLKKGPVVLVFYRSADWCPYCKQQLVDLQRNLKQIETGGGQLVGISYDSVPNLQRFANKRISFPLLSDTASRTIDAYDVRDKSTKDGIAYHTTFVVDRKGIVRAKLYQVSYAEPSAVDALLKAIAQAR